MSVQIRSVKPTEKKQWVKLFQNYADFYQTTIPDGGCDTVWEWIFDDTNPFWCDVALINDNEIIGFTQYQLMHRSLGGSMVCYLSDLYVEPDKRGLGVGRKMIDHVISFAEGRDLPGVRWLTQDFNYSARRLYDTYQTKTDFILYNVPTRKKA